jgi:hypothetical protein
MAGQLETLTIREIKLRKSVTRGTTLAIVEFVHQDLNRRRVYDTIEVGNESVLWRVHQLFEAATTPYEVDSWTNDLPQLLDKQVKVMTVNDSFSGYPQVKRYYKPDTEYKSAWVPPVEVRANSEEEAKAKILNRIAEELEINEVR